MGFCGVVVIKYAEENLFSGILCVLEMQGVYEKFKKI